MTKKSIENVEQRDKAGRFITGNVTGPGRPLGSRNKFAQQYIDDFYTVWQEEGIEALRAAARETPGKFISVAASLIPQHFKVEHEHTLTMSVDELRAKLLELRAQLIEDGVDPALLVPPVEGEGA